MNKNKVLTIVIVLCIAVIIFAIVKNLNNKDKGLASPILPVAAPTNNTPKEIIYDNSTDLSKELESVNPQVLDKDFMVE